MLGSLLSAGANLLGGLFGKSSADANRASHESIANRNIELQKEFAQHGVRWKVADARAAGINPLAALGSPATSFSPVAIGNTSDSSMQTALTNMGQDLGRAVNATRTGGERNEAFAVTALQLEGMQLDNDIKRASLASSIQRLRQNANPPMPGEIVPSTGAGKRPDIFVGGDLQPSDPSTGSVDDTWQKRYGEPGEWLGAPIVLWHDYMGRTEPFMGEEQRRRSSSWIGRQLRRLPVFERFMPRSSGY